MARDWLRDYVNRADAFRFLIDSLVGAATELADKAEFCKDSTVSVQTDNH
ncbi:hypothetical protein Metme_0069 [Methylomonas methanica MC09]|uniref:Uncharacterized protein n=1 Tax=Methylomonas methanica (strain DSM 25384 / MC09) TaxID=857087 RepID=F9ZXU2_METMM|nr:hypothetical protein Metme_0069 [Methylomonas methanica MC09]